MTVLLFTSALLPNIVIFFKRGLIQPHPEKQLLFANTKKGAGHAVINEPRCEKPGLWGFPTRADTITEYVLKFRM